MNILCIGDIVSEAGRTAVRNLLEDTVKEYKINITIANGENLSHGNGISLSNYEELSRCGVDVFTLGNHTWGNKDIYKIFKHERNVIRPANFEKGCPGFGSCVIEKNGVNVGVINLIGRVGMPVPCNSPFHVLTREAQRLKMQTNIIIIDFHAEATSEKQALGWFADGKVSAVFGTHTHVQTADEMILPKGTGYITDIGMTGAMYSVIGMEREAAVNRFLTGIHHKAEPADGKYRLSGAVFEIDEQTGMCRNIIRINKKER